MAKRKSQKSKREKKKENIKQLDIEVGSRFRELRKANGLTQEQMAEAIGKSVATIYNYEKGITRIT